MKTHFMSASTLSVALLSLVGWSAIAGDAHYTPRTYKDVGYADSTVWQDGYVPTNATDVVWLGEGFDDETLQSYPAPLQGGRFYPASGRAYPASITIDSFGFAVYGFSIYMPSGEKFTLRDAANCYWDWRMNASDITIAKATGTAGSLVLHNLFGAQGMILDAPAATDTIEVENLFGSGLLRKKGAGTVRLDRPAGKPQLVEIQAGTLDIGHDIAEDALPDDRYFHLDASDASTLFTQVADGRTYVTNWVDADGKKLLANKMSNVGAPFVNTETSPSGLPLVSFGGYSEDADDQATHGPAAALNLHCQSGVKEIFQVVKRNGSNGWGCYVSQYYHDGYRLVNSSTSLMTYGHNTLWHSTYYARLNGIPHRDAPRNPNCLGVVSSWSETDSGGWYLCFDYGDNSKYGGYSIGEIVAYTRVLSEAERQGVIRYLNGKWLAQDEKKVWDAGVLAVRGNGTEVKVDAGRRADIHGVRVYDAKRTFTKTGDGTLALEQTYPETATVTVNGGEVEWQQTAEAEDDPQIADDPYLHLDASVASSFVRDGDAVTMWKDCRATSTLCATSEAAATEFPYVTAGAVNGRDALDFGTVYATGKPFFRIKDLSGASLPQALHAFYVWENLTGSKDAVPCALGGGDWTFKRTDKTCIAGSWYDACSAIKGGVWRLDGVPTARDGEAYGQGFGEAQVVSAAFPESLNIFLLGACRANAAEAKGGARVAEVILYSRRLSESEKRNTEAYLLKKWKGIATHPSLRTTVAGISFGTGVTPKLNVANGSRTFASVTGSGTLVKTGAGSARVVSLGSGITGVDLREGALEMEGDATAPNAISIRIDKEGTVSGALSASGALTLPDSGTLTVTYEDEDADAPLGTLPFATASAVSGGAHWTVVTESTRLKRRVLSVTVGPTSASLTIVPAGMFVIIR